MLVEVRDLNMSIEFDENEIFSCEEFEENVFIDGIWYANDDSEWIRVGTEEQYWEEHTTHHQFN